MTEDEIGFSHPNSLNAALDKACNHKLVRRRVRGREEKRVPAAADRPGASVPEEAGGPQPDQLLRRNK